MSVESLSRIRGIVSSCLIVLSVSLTKPVYAGLSCIYGTETAISQDGRFILVRIDPHSSREEELAYEGLSQSAKDEINSIRANFPQSGLYLNDGSRRLLWSYNGRWCDGGPIIAPGGEYAIFPGRWIYDEDQIEAVEFMRNGQAICKYNSSDLIPHYWFKWLVNGRQHPSCVGALFDAHQMTYSILTSQNEEFVLDVKTGNCIAIRSPYRTIYAVTVISLVAALALPLRWWWRKRRLRNTTAAPVALRV